MSTTAKREKRQDNVLFVLPVSPRTEFTEVSTLDKLKMEQFYSKGLLDRSHWRLFEHWSLWSIIKQYHSMVLSAQ